MKQKVYTKEFRDSTVQLVLNSDKSVLSIGADLDVNPKTIYNWTREYRKLNDIKTDDQRSTIKETLEEENKRLRRELAIVIQEREILKKATAYFAKGTL